LDLAFLFKFMSGYQESKTPGWVVPARAGVAKTSNLLAETGERKKSVQCSHISAKQDVSLGLSSPSSFS
jgi:hypothetical protein